MAQLVEESSGDEPLWVEPMREVIIEGGKTLISAAVDNFSLSDFGLFGSGPRQNDAQDHGSLPSRSETESESESATETVSPADRENPGSDGGGPSTPGDPKFYDRDEPEANPGDLVRVDAEGEVFWMRVRTIDRGRAGRIEYVGSPLSDLPSLNVTQQDQVAVSAANVTKTISQASASFQRPARPRQARTPGAGSGRTSARPDRERENKAKEETNGRSVIRSEEGGPVDRHWDRQ